VVPILVLKSVSVMHQVRRAFEVFDALDRDLAQFVEIKVFPRCDQFLVPIYSIADTERGSNTEPLCVLEQGS
jgi:hypothetical protein